MGLILRLLFSALVGFAAHIFWKPSRAFGDLHGRRWGAKVRHAIGVLTMAIPQAMICDRLDMPHGKIRAFIASLLAGLSYGGGNMLAHFMDD
ncbi:MAG: hypothetical protein DSY80_05830 [Desulfocapsa sp.]|nr:MAG: hypothetical protein DSY80_05830 [Desulfocapsa sp.]